MMLWMAIGLLVGVFGIVHVVFIRETSAPGMLNNDALKRLADELGVQFTVDKIRDKTSPNILGRLSGTVKQFKITAREEAISSTDPIPYRCIYEIHTNGHTLSDKLLLYREGPPSKVGKILGGEDIEVGHALIDEAFVIRDTTPGSAKAMFSRPDVVDAFMHLTTLTPRIIFENHKLSIIHTGKRLDAEQARLNINALVRCAQLLSDKQDTTRHDENHRAKNDSFTQGRSGKSPTWQATTP